jgi:hypothetical protein
MAGKEYVTNAYNMFYKKGLDIQADPTMTVEAKNEAYKKLTFEYLDSHLGSIRTNGLAADFMNNKKVFEILFPKGADGRPSIETIFGKDFVELSEKNGRNYFLINNEVKRSKIVNTTDVYEKARIIKTNGEPYNESAKDNLDNLKRNIVELLDNGNLEQYFQYVNLQNSPQSAFYQSYKFGGYEKGVERQKNSVFEHDPPRTNFIKEMMFLPTIKNATRRSIAIDNLISKIENGRVYIVSEGLDKKLPKTSAGVRYTDKLLLDHEIITPNGERLMPNKQTSRASKTLNEDFNEILDKNFGAGASNEISSITARTAGAGKGKYRFFVPPSAEDFAGLLYDFMGKGAEGEAQAKFFEKNLIDPYIRGVQRMDNIRSNIKEGYKALKADYPAEAKKLKQEAPGKSFTYDQAVRVYLWKKNGTTVPGLSETEVNQMSNYVKRDQQLREFADKLSEASGQLKGWVEPTEYWNVESIVSDLHNATEKIGRRNILKDFIENSEQIFSPENLNKIEAALGTNYRSALEDSLFRMKNGSNQTSTDKFSGAFVNWIANANGTIMFLNTRSAILQTIAATNYLNWSDNNPVAAGAAFLNQPQYWKDFSMIFNSNKLKERRAGLKADVNEAEIANAVRGSKNKAKAALSYLLKIGYTPTQLADSFAIAAGGSTFYRNRVKTYEKQGLSKAEAEAKAFDDFDKATEESQQSSDPSKLSQQQASTAGRLILAFANTPMQYNRLMKKAFRDLKNGRGDAKTHVSKILYYGAVQNVVFSALQNALFASLFDDDEPADKQAKAQERKYANILNGMLDTILRGTGIAGAVVSTAKNVVTKFAEEREKGFKGDQGKTLIAAAGISPPIGSKAAKLYSAINTEKIDKDIIDKRGMDVTLDGKLNLSPSYDIAGKVVASTTNFPLDRLVDKVNNVSEVLDSRNKTWQRVALALGWKAFDVGTLNEGEDLIRAEAKAERKEASYEKSYKDRIIKNAKLKARIGDMSPDEYMTYQDSLTAVKEKKKERRRKLWEETETLRDSIENSKN